MSFRYTLEFPQIGVIVWPHELGDVVGQIAIDPGIVQWIGGVRSLREMIAAQTAEIHVGRYLVAAPGTGQRPTCILLRAVAALAVRILVATVIGKTSAAVFIGSIRIRTIGICAVGTGVVRIGVFCVRAVGKVFL